MSAMQGVSLALLKVQVMYADPPPLPVASCVPSQVMVELPHQMFPPGTICPCVPVSNVSTTTSASSFGTTQAAKSPAQIQKDSKAR
ncbi:MAG: hypothetical protein U1F98_16960 [Verrucomicrobiota bacterium]